MKRKMITVYLTCSIMLMLTINASAYLDPSVMTYTIQVVAGIVVAIGAVVGIWWRKAKRKVQNKLGIDENSRKEVEADIEVLEDKKQSE